MGRFNPNDYATVEERLTEFWNEYPQGRVWTNMERLEGPMVVFRAEVFRDHDDAHPAAVGYAYEKEGAGHVNKTSFIENCETSAVGRALANLGLHGKKGAPRPSREEMEKVERMSERNDGVLDEVRGLLDAIPDDADFDAKTRTALTRIRTELEHGNAAFCERSLEWLKGVAQVSDGVQEMEGAA